MSVGERPLGVTILSILGFIFSGLVLLGGLAVTIFGAAFLPAGGDLGGLLGFLGGLMSVIGIVLVFTAVIGLVLSWGLWSRKYWAWLITLILEVLSVVGSLGALIATPVAALPGIAVSAIIVYYLLQPPVRAWFEGKPAPATAYPPPPPSYA